METSELTSILEFLKVSEKLKDTLRSGRTSQGRVESVAEHTWRLCLIAVIFHQRFFPQLDFQRLLKICVIHDLGELINGDIPAPHQTNSKSDAERNDLLIVLEHLPVDIKDEFLKLWDEYESASSEEAKLAKALDKIETLIQHNQGKNPASFDYEFNIDYGRERTEFNEIISTFRSLVDEETRRNAGK